MQYLITGKTKKRRNKKIKKIYIFLIAAVIFYGCGSVGGVASEADLGIMKEPAERAVETGYRYAGTSVITIKPGRVRTIAVSYNSEEKVNDSEFVWAVMDSGIISIRGMGSKCAIVGKQEGSTMVVVTSPEILLPYAFEVICTNDERVEKTFQRTMNERTEGRLVGGWSGIEMTEKQGK
jgi:hypothetical protein